MNDQTEIRFAELNHDPAHPRRLRGVVVRYGEPSLIDGRFYESVRAGAFGDVSKLDLVLNLQHERPRPLARTGGGGLTLRDTQEALTLEAILPTTQDANDALKLVRGNILRGLSVEMRRIQDSWTGDQRTIHSAMLGGVGLVDSPAYASSLVEQKARGGGGGGRGGGGGLGRAFGALPFEKFLECRCHKKGQCTNIVLQKTAFDEALQDVEKEILIVANEFSRALGSRKRGTLRLEKTDEGLEWEADLPDIQAVQDLLEQSKFANVIARPVFRPEESVFTEQGGVARYSKMQLRAIQLGITDADTGWPAVTFGEKAKPNRNQRKNNVGWRYGCSFIDGRGGKTGDGVERYRRNTVSRHCHGVSVPILRGVNSFPRRCE